MIFAALFLLALATLWILWRTMDHAADVIGWLISKRRLRFTYCSDMGFSTWWYPHVIWHRGCYSWEFLSHWLTIDWGRRRWILQRERWSA